MKTAVHAFLFLLLVVAIAPDCPAVEITDDVSLDALPPSVVRTVPLCGDTAVDPNLSEISVTFSKDMKVTGHCWSWCSVQESSFPVLSGDTEYLEDNRTCVLHVALEPEKTYAIWINVDQFQSFQDTDGHPAVPYLLVFRTGPGE
jgi:RNA polymerase sigma-70 factor (ECF subfamily)